MQILMQGKGSLIEQARSVIIVTRPFPQFFFKKKRNYLAIPKISGYFAFQSSF